MEKNTFFSSFKIILLTRHGQRIDFTSLKTKQKLHTDDPELSQTGREQAVKMAKKISEFLLRKFKITISDKNLQIISSPFSRTLQTSLGLMQGYGLKTSKIKVDNKLSELIFHWVVGDIPIKYVALYQKPFNIEFKNKFEEHEKSKFEFYDSKLTTEYLPAHYESQNDVYTRCVQCFSNNKDLFLTSKNNENLSDDRIIEVIQFVSHAGILEIIRNYLTGIINKRLEEQIKLESKQNCINGYNNGKSYGNDSFSIEKEKIPFLPYVTTDYYGYCDTDVFIVNISSSQNKEDFGFIGKITL